MSVFLLKIAEKVNIVPYKQRVTGSNPVAPTVKSLPLREAFFCPPLNDFP